MKLITRLVILITLSCGTPCLTPAGFAISGSPLAQQKIQKKEISPSKKLKTKRRHSFRIKLPKNQTKSIKSPKNLFFGGLITVGIGAMMLLGASKTDPAKIDETINAIFLSIIGSMAVAGGALAALIGGIMWIFAKQ